MNIYWGNSLYFSIVYKIILIILILYFQTCTENWSWGDVNEAEDGYNEDPYEEHLTKVNNSFIITRHDDHEEEYNIWQRMLNDLDVDIEVDNGW